MPTPTAVTLDYHDVERVDRRHSPRSTLAREKCREARVYIDGTYDYLVDLVVAYYYANTTLHQSRL